MSDYGVDARTGIMAVPIGTLAPTVDATFPIIALPLKEGEIRKAVWINNNPMGAGDINNNRMIAIVKNGVTVMHSWSNNGQTGANGIPMPFVPAAAAARRFGLTDTVSVRASHTGPGGDVVTATVIVYYTHGLYDEANP